MSKVDDMRKLKEDIIASYDARVATVGEIISNVHEIANGTRSMLGRFHQERQETVNELKEMSNELKERSNELKENLAQNESARLSVFGALFDDIQTLLNNIVTLQGGRRVEVAKILSEAKASRIESFGELMNEVQSKLNEIRTRQKEREEEVSSLLKAFGNEQQEMSNALNEAFERARASRSEAENARLEAENARLQEIKAFLDAVREKRNARENEVKSLQNEVKSLLNNYTEEREGMAAAWRSLSEIIQQRKAGVSIEVTPVAEEEAPPTEPAVPEVEEVSAEETAPVAEEETPPTEPAAPEVEEVSAEETAPVAEEEAPPTEPAAPVFEVAPPVEEEAIPVEEEVPDEETVSAEGDRGELQDKMLSLINSHAAGLKLVDLGEELGVPWRSLIPLARNLVESDQVTKVDVFYYPAGSDLDLQVVMAGSETKEAKKSEEG
jgi:uncharacterized coiled-coil DUF342 family protein